jgi:hypothetical protein
MRFTTLSNIADISAWAAVRYRSFASCGVKANASRSNSRFCATHNRRYPHTPGGTYLKCPGEEKYHAHVFQVLTFRDGRIGRVTPFVGPEHFAKFGLAPMLGGAP